MHCVFHLFSPTRQISSSSLLPPQFETLSPPIPPSPHPQRRLLVADPGGFTGNAEARSYLVNLKLTHHTVCAGKFFGTIMGLPIVVVTTGQQPRVHS